jgi:hypothetical protein
MIDELALLLNKKLRIKVATLSSWHGRLEGGCVCVGRDESIRGSYQVSRGYGCTEITSSARLPEGQPRTQA